jgi:hypothetical protein
MECGVDGVDALGIRLPLCKAAYARSRWAIATLSVIIQTLGNALAGFINKYIAPFVQGLTGRMGGTLQDLAGRARWSPTSLSAWPRG